MKIIYSTKYEECYVPTYENPDKVRLPSIELKEAGYEFVEPTAASDEDVARVYGRKDANFDYLNMDEKGYLRQVEDAFEGFEYDIVAISAGFDTYIEDWGGLLTNDDFFNMGRTIKEFSKLYCSGKRFAILEGGYHSDLKYNIKNFIEGFA